MGYPVVAASMKNEPGHREQFSADVSSFAGELGVPSDASVEDFLTTYPLAFILSVLQAEDCTPELEAATCAALERIFRSSYGLSQLPAAMPYVSMGVSTMAASPALRRLSCSLVTKMLRASADPDAAVLAVANAQLPPALVACLADQNEGVAAEAAAALAALCARPGGLRLLFAPDGAWGGARFKSLACDAAATVRLRAMAVAVAVAQLSAEAAQAAARAGLLDAIAGALAGAATSDADVLAAITTLDLVSALAQAEWGAQLLASSGVAAQLASIIAGERTDALVRAAALSSAAHLLAPPPPATSPTIPSSAGQAALLGALERFLEERCAPDVRPSSGSAVEEQAALDAVAHIAASAGGSEMILLRPTQGHAAPAAATCAARLAFDSHAAHDLQLAGVRALASLAGAWRGSSRSSSSRDYGGRGAVVLGERAEAVLRDCLFGAAAAAAPSAGGPTLAGVVWALMRHKAGDMRSPAYDLTEALAARPWGVREVCSHAALVDFIVSPASESTPQGQEMRHRCCQALAAAAAGHQEGGPLPCLHQLDEAARGGPRGAATRRSSAIPLVTTDERPPTGL